MEPDSAVLPPLPPANASPVAAVGISRALARYSCRGEVEFRKEAQAMGFELAPQTGARIAALVEAAMATPKEVVEKAQRASTAE